MMKYKGYIGQVTYDDEAKLLHGEVINIRDVITFQGQSVAEMEQAFRDSVDDYLEMCAERGEAPDKPFSGRFVLRLDPELHRDSFGAAKPPVKASIPGSQTPSATPQSEMGRPLNRSSVMACLDGVGSRFSANSDVGTQVLSSIRHLDYVVLLCDDLPRIKQLYHEVMGFPIYLDTDFLDRNAGGLCLTLALEARSSICRSPAA